MKHCHVRCALALSWLPWSLALPAQSERVTAHPQDVPHVGTGQLNPFGDFFTSCEARSQLLLRAEHLPGPGAVLLAIEVSPLFPAPVLYESLEITVSALSPAQPRSMTFDLNLPAPVVVVQLANHTQNWTGPLWDRLVTTQPYVHDGASHLTIDIKKDASPAFGSGGCSGLFRPDLETMLVTFGGAGSGANTAVNANLQVIPIDVRLVWSDAPASYLSSPIPAPNLHGFGIGSTLSHFVRATPGSLFATVFDTQWSPPITLPFALGQWHVQGTVLGADVIFIGGVSVMNVPIPFQPTLVGQHLTWQALVIDGTTGNWQFTNGSDCFIE